MKYNPLVSVVVLTYNSSKTVIATLNSIAAQTYKNIELIITDDGSQDDTVYLVKTWLNNNKDNFVRIVFETVEFNTGTVRNINRGVKVSSGAWIKGIAGDDLLLPNAIKCFVDFVHNTPDCKMCCCDLQLFANDGNDIDKTKELYDYYFNCVKEPWRRQWKRIKHDLALPGPGYFFSRELYNEIGGFDEDYILLDETPFVFYVLKKGYRIYPVIEKLVLYRISSSSVCRGQFSNTFKVLLNDKYNFFKKHQFPALVRSGKFLTALKYLVNYNRIEKEMNFGIDSFEARFAKLLYIFSPLHYFSYVQKLICNIRNFIK